jgi:hypothetical protein
VERGQGERFLPERGEVLFVLTPDPSPQERGEVRRRAIVIIALRRMAPPSPVERGQGERFLPERGEVLFVLTPDPSPEGEGGYAMSSILRNK